MLVYLRIFQPDLKQYTQPLSGCVYTVLLQLGTNGVAVRARHRYRNTDLMQVLLFTSDSHFLGVQIESAILSL